MGERYLRCRVWTNIPIQLFSDEVLITFKSEKPENIRLIYKGENFPPKGEDWRIVSNRDIKLYEKGYFVRLYHHEQEQKKKLALIGVRDCSEQRVYFSAVPLEEIVVI